MEKHILCYVQRKRISDWKRLAIAHAQPAFVYGSNDGRAFPQLRCGDTLWIVASVPDRPPELVARLNVTGIAPKGGTLPGVSEQLLAHFREFNWVVLGGKGSCFFGHNAAGETLLQTVFTNQSGGQRKLATDALAWQMEYGSKLRRPALIHPQSGAGIPGSRPLEQLSSRPQVFISWKWRDHQAHLPQVFELAYALAEAGFIAWLDKLALPASRATRLKINPDPDVLENLLAYGYRRCLAVLALESEHYGDPSPNSIKNWTLREWDGSLAAGKMPIRIAYQPEYSLRSKVTAPADLRLKAGTARQAASELQAWFHENRLDQSGKME